GSSERILVRLFVDRIALGGGVLFGSLEPVIPLTQTGERIGARCAARVHRQSRLDGVRQRLELLRVDSHEHVRLGRKGRRGRGGGRGGGCGGSDGRASAARRRSLFGSAGAFVSAGHFLGVVRILIRLLACAARSSRRSVLRDLGAFLLREPTERISEVKKSTKHDQDDREAAPKKERARATPLLRLARAGASRRSLARRVRASSRRVGTTVLGE